MGNNFEIDYQYVVKTIETARTEFQLNCATNIVKQFYANYRAYDIAEKLVFMLNQAKQKNRDIN
jgi:hypothetical protein